MLKKPTKPLRLRRAISENLCGRICTRHTYVRKHLSHLQMRFPIAVHCAMVNTTPRLASALTQAVDDRINWRWRQQRSKNKHTPKKNKRLEATIWQTCVRNPPQRQSLFPSPFTDRSAEISSYPDAMRVPVSLCYGWHIRIQEDRLIWHCIPWAWDVSLQQRSVTITH